LACLDFGMAKIGSKTKQTLSLFPNSNDGDYSRTLLVQYIYSTIGGMCLNDLLRLEGIVRLGARLGTPRRDY